MPTSDKRKQDHHERYDRRLSYYQQKEAGAATLNLAPERYSELERAVTRGKFHWLRALAVSRLIFHCRVAGRLDQVSKIALTRRLGKGESLDPH